MAPQSAQVIIVGAGFGGLAMAAKLKEQGIEDFLVLERAGDVGGVWHWNTYPGCMCDVPSNLYSLSFAPNPEWSHTYSPQAEIREYLRGVADRFGLRPHLRTGVSLESAAYDPDAAEWALETSAGPFRARFLVSAMGPLTEPSFPDVPGIERFEGKVMHSARWDHDYDLAGRRVASIGTGASAIQYVPAIQPDVERLHVLQRTPPWVMPHNDRPVTDRERSIFRRFPFVQRAVRAGIYGGRELLVLGFAKEPRLMGLFERIGRSHIAKQVRDPELRAKVTPSYRYGCKRVLPSNRWYPALGKENVELIDGGLAEVRENSVFATDGTEREVDAIIFGTGFHVTDIPAAGHIRGREGTLLADAWAGSPRAYAGSTIPGFPNFFMLLGPNTGLGHGSMVYMLESQVAHVAGALGAAARRDAAVVEVRPEAHAAYNRDIDRQLAGSVWDTGGCSSFYFDANGHNATLWPDFTWRFRRIAANFDTGAYRFEARASTNVNTNEEREACVST